MSSLKVGFLQELKEALKDIESSEERDKIWRTMWEECLKREAADLPFVEKNLMPNNGEKRHETGHSAVNAIAILEGISWREAYDRLLYQAHRHCCMPDYDSCRTDKDQCVHALLEAHGFIRQPDSVKDYRFGNLFRLIQTYCSSGAIFLVRMHTLYRGTNTVLIEPTPNPSGYRIFGETLSPLHLVTELWVRWPDGQDHSPIPRRKRKDAGNPRRVKVQPYYRDTGGAYRHYSATPIAQGDCVIRAISAACVLSWHEAVEALAESCEYRTTILNVKEVYSKLLEKRGFQHHDVLKRKGRMLTGKEFCRYLDENYHRGEPVFAHISRNHVVAIRADGGNYRILDNWDSSDHKVGEFWVGKPTRKARKA